MLLSFSLFINAFSFTFLDVDECSLMGNLCKNGRCINAMGSYRCICNKGYKPDQSGTKCVGKKIL